MNKTFQVLSNELFFWPPQEYFEGPLHHSKQNKLSKQEYIDNIDDDDSEWHMEHIERNFGGIELKPTAGETQESIDAQTFFP